MPCVSAESFAAAIGAPFELANSADAIVATSIPSPDGINSSGDLALVSRRNVSLTPALLMNDGGGLESAGQNSTADLLAPLLATVGGSNAELVAFANRYDFDSQITPVNVGFKPNFADGVESLSNANAIVGGVGGADPFLATSIRVTNPYDVGVTYRFETSLDIAALDTNTAVLEGKIVTELFDSGGLPGAELTFNAGFTVRGENSQDQFFVFDLEDSGTIGPGEVSLKDLSEQSLRFGPGEPIDKILSSVFLTLTPGDTAVVTVIGNFGDAGTPLFDLAAIESSLQLTSDFARSFAIPEPTIFALIVTGSVMATALRNPAKSLR